MDLHPGETIVFEGHPSWRALLSFYIGGLAGALAIAVIVWLISGIALAVLVGGYGWPLVLRACSVTGPVATIQSAPAKSQSTPDAH